MATKKPTKKPAAKKAAGMRTENEWRASPLYGVAMEANLSAKQLFNLAQQQEIDTGPDSWVDRHFKASCDYIEDAENAWRSGNEREAARAIMLSGVCVGLMARDDAILRKQITSAANEARHAVSRTARDDAIRTYRQSQFQSKDHAAEEFTRRTLGTPPRKYAYSTIRRWLQGV